MTQRVVRHPYLALFDAPDTNTSTDVRSASTVPLQSLYMLNNPFVFQQSEGFAKRLLAADPAARLGLATRIAWGREPSEEETKKYTDYVTRYRDKAIASGTLPPEAELQAWSSLARALITTNEFIYVD